jgi:hypothetical protein
MEKSEIFTMNCDTILDLFGDVSIVCSYPPLRNLKMNHKKHAIRSVPSGTIFFFGIIERWTGFKSWYYIKEIAIFLMHQIKSYSGINIENVPDGTQILKIVRHIYFQLKIRYRTKIKNCSGFMKVDQILKVWSLLSSKIIISSK